MEVPQVLEGISPDSQGLRKRPQEDFVLVADPA